MVLNFSNFKTYLNFDYYASVSAPPEKKTTLYIFFTLILIQDTQNYMYTSLFFLQNVFFLKLIRYWKVEDPWGNWNSLKVGFDDFSLDEVSFHDKLFTFLIDIQSMPSLYHY